METCKYKEKFTYSTVNKDFSDKLVEQKKLEERILKLSGQEDILLDLRKDIFKKYKTTKAKRFLLQNELEKISTF